MPSCKEVSRLVSEAMDRELPVGRRLAVRIHLTMCRFCDRYRRQLLAIRETLRRCAAERPDAAADPGFALSPEARDRIRRSLGSS
jgi:hypothetical protein